MSRFTILLGGDLARTPRLDVQVAGSRVIAADGGMPSCSRRSASFRNCGSADFDSVPTGLEDAYPACRAR